MIEESIRPALPIVVMTDLDGTLLDHDNYSTVDAKPALKWLNTHQVPVIFNTSKTYNEVYQLRRTLDNHYPFVCENGSAIFVPKSDGKGYNTEFVGLRYSAILKILHQLRQQGFHFRGFNDMPATEVAALTGLSIEDAHSAKSRDGTEPILWQGSDEELLAFKLALAEHKLQLLEGGRFLHVMSQVDKAEGVIFFRHHYQELWQANPIIIALGDSDNDRGMLEAADYPIVIPGKKSTLKINNSAVQYATSHGPKGWNQTLLPLLEQLLKETRSG